jgi:hypothetical protein
MEGASGLALTFGALFDSHDCPRFTDAFTERSREQPCTGIQVPPDVARLDGSECTNTLLKQRGRAAVHLPEARGLQTPLSLAHVLQDSTITDPIDGQGDMPVRTNGRIRVIAVDVGRRRSRDLPSRNETGVHRDHLTAS